MHSCALSGAVPIEGPTGIVRIQNLCVGMFILETMKKIETGKVVLTKEGESGGILFPRLLPVFGPIGCFRNRAYDDEFV